ncbi:hypothetical protein ACFU99_03890 [Streptomyces sp. NPDC057654]|uniref:hypothetical protein n=1 Tax=Streptomyces sp. NPDC057654 TaxID=3346196 RepID=UPI0036C6BCEB
MPRWLKTHDDPPRVVPGKFQVSFEDPAPLEAPLTEAQFWCERRRKVAETDPIGGLGQRPSAASASRTLAWLRASLGDATLTEAQVWCEQRRRAQSDTVEAVDQQLAENTSRALAWLRAELGDATRDWPPAQADLLLVWFRDARCLEAHYNALGFLYMTFAVTVIARGHSTTWRIRRSHQTRRARVAPPLIPEGQAV